MSDWYIVDDQGLDGPYTLNELRVMRRDGELGSNDRVQEGTNARPQKVSSVAQLRSKSRSTGRGSKQGQSSGIAPVVIILCVVAGIFVLGVGIAVVALVMPAVQQTRVAASRARAQDRLHNIAIALHNYESTYRTFPPGGVFDDDGREHYGWCTALLPFVEEMPLYDQLDVGRTTWKDPFVQPFLQQPVPAYLNDAAPSETTSSGLAATHYSANSHIMYENSSTRIRDITDGTSNTLLIGEISTAFPSWADPHNFRDPGARLGDSSHQFNGINSAGCQFALGDAKVQFISENIDPQVLKGLGTHNGGEPVRVP